MVTKYFFNDTPFNIEITLFEAGREGSRLKTSGSRIVTIASGLNCSVPIGDLHHSFLRGVRVKTTNEAEYISLQRGTNIAEGRLYSLLNEHDSFKIACNDHSFTIEEMAH